MASLPITNPDFSLTRQAGLCQFINLKEENARIVLLAILLLFYLGLGAIIFQTLEEPEEMRIKSEFVELYEEFVWNLTGTRPNAFGFEREGAEEYDLSESSAHLSFGEMSVNGSYFGSGNNEFGLISSSFHKLNGREQPSLDDLHKLFFAYGNATQAGVIWKRRRWDFIGSFHFTWTIVSTIGYGATTPATNIGKLLVIPYGFFGCAGGLLFFNLFLERIITFFAACMRTYRIRKQKRNSIVYGVDIKGVWSGKLKAKNVSSPAVSTIQTASALALPTRGTSPTCSSTGEGSVLEETDWKPSVYWVMLCLFLMSSVVIFGSAFLFQAMEGWSFADGVYFSFVSYATIGFGDLVSLQKKSYGDWEILYKAAAFIVMVFGCCCIYSLLNVTSIVIKKVLNWLIQKIHHCECCRCCFAHCQGPASTMRRLSTRRRKNSGRIGKKKHFNSHSNHSRKNFPAAVLNAGSSGICIDLDERRCSGENMTSIRGELSNKVSLAVMQKRLYETAQMSRHSGNYESSFSATSVEPLAIVSQKLGDSH